MKRQPSERTQADSVIVTQMGQAREAARKGEERWFVFPENRRGGLELGIGTYVPATSRIADMFYFGEPSDLIVSNAHLIVEAVNACFRVNPTNPRATARAYGELVRACQNVVALEMADTRHDPAVHKVVEIVANALEEARREA